MAICYSESNYEDALLRAYESLGGDRNDVTQDDVRHYWEAYRDGSPEYEPEDVARLMFADRC